MTERNRVLESKKERQKTLDKLSIESGRAYTYDTRDEKGSGCLSKAKDARERNQRKLDR